MRIVVEHPPNFDAILAVFPDAAKPGTIFSWGDTLYVPKGGNITPALIAHEEVHGARQIAMGIMVWWRHYLDDAEFRLAEELPAHKAEYRTFCNKFHDRERRTRELMKIAARLASPLYGNLLTPTEARRRIKA